MPQTVQTKMQQRKRILRGNKSSFFRSRSHEAKEKDLGQREREDTDHWGGHHSSEGLDHVEPWPAVIYALSVPGLIHSWELSYDRLYSLLRPYHVKFYFYLSRDRIYPPATLFQVNYLHIDRCFLQQTKSYNHFFPVAFAWWQSFFVFHHYWLFLVFFVRQYVVKALRSDNFVQIINAWEHPLITACK